MATMRPSRREGGIVRGQPKTRLGTARGASARDPVATCSKLQRISPPTAGEGGRGERSAYMTSDPVTEAFGDGAWKDWSAACE